MSSDNRITYDPMRSGMIGSISGRTFAEGSLNTTLSATTIHLGNSRITEEDIVKFRKLLDFMDFALGASEELRNLMVAYEAKQRILK
jgi:hypothetical protein